jgi:hypothetical protein
MGLIRRDPCGLSHARRFTPMRHLRESAMLSTIASASAAVSASAAILLGILAGSPARAEMAQELRISGAVVHENLAVYLVHGTSRSGPVPLTLQEAMEARHVVVRETGQVNMLEIENVGDREVFLQSGDILKGGKQDRVVTSSLVLPPRSGAVPIESFCVEQGRWSQRGAEDGRTFHSAAAALPSRVGRLALAGASVRGDEGRAPDARRPETQSRQQQVWSEVAAIQQKLSRTLAAPVAAPRSRTSLQLSLENEKLREVEAQYLKTLEPVAADDDVVGYAIAVNGKLASADVYPSNGLFRKLWPKLLRASIAEAIGEKLAEPSAEPPRPESVKVFLDDAQRAEATQKVLPTRGTVEIRESGRVMFQQAMPAPSPAKPASGAWMHRSYLAK